MSYRLLAVVSGLTLGDYLLWNWSLAGNHDVLALASGLTLPPLAIAFVWMFALFVLRLVATATRRAPVMVERSAGARARRVAPGRLADEPAPSHRPRSGAHPEPASAAVSRERPARKIAA